MVYMPKNLRLWRLPENYFGPIYTGMYSAGVGQTRDSDALERSNFRCMLAALGGESETVTVVRNRHWLIGWMEWIAIKQSDETALREADDIIDALNVYPVIDEYDFTETEQQDAS